MSSFFGGNIKSGAPEVADVLQRKEEVKLQIQQELAVANAQLLIEKINENCFAKCVTKPSTSLSTSEQACLSSCVGLYSSAFDTISQKYVSRVVRERQNGLGDVKLE